MNLGAYGYVRISRDEDGSKESITSQMDTFKDFAKDQGIELIDVIKDNDNSGYSYNRPGIKSIIELVESFTPKKFHSYKGNLVRV